MSHFQPTVVATNFSLGFIKDLMNDTFNTRFSLYTVAEVVQDLQLNRTCEILLASVEIPLTRDYLNDLKSLRYLISPATGKTHIDLDYLESRSIVLLSLSKDNEIRDQITSSSEFAWGLFLNLHRGILLADRRAHYFDGYRNLYWSVQVPSLTIGVIGFGRIGKKLSHYATAFGARVLVNDLFSSAEVTDYEFTSLQNLVQESDVIFICASVGENMKSTVILNAELIEIMKPEAILVNVARGCLIDEKKLLDSLKLGKIRGFATDVLGMNDLQNHAEVSLTSQDIEQAMNMGLNIIVTPHIAGASRDALKLIINSLFIELEKMMRVE
jgi:phosphoglycerate dehydrogenase-like enzyme